ncbi:MAG TPA: serine hydrolase, partial [Candidatus Acidoferrales bacterium]|nr:serine hydrolase [Candidatus Acidoferrales bacterium]
MRSLNRFLAAILVVVSVLAGRPADASTADLVAHLDELAGSFPGGVGLWIADPNTAKPLYTRNPDEPVIAASLYKLGILAEAERRVDSGELKYSDIITIEPEDITEDGSFEDAGVELTLDEALEAMITISDNGAALALWHFLGPENIDATLTKIGLADFHVALNDEEDNVVTPRAVGTYFTMLAKRQLISPAASDRMLARLERQQINNRLPADLPDGVVIAHKTGNLVGAVHDAGIIYTPFGPRVVVAMTWDAYDDEADPFIASVGSIVYSAVLEPPANARYAVPRTAVSADTDSHVRVTITITNAGTNTWAASGGGSFGLIWEMRDDNDALVSSSATQTRLPALAPGRSTNIGLQLPTPLIPGTFHVTLGLVDSNGRALAAMGAATAQFDITTHQPFLVNATVSVPTLLHRGEASLLVTQYAALGTAGIVDHSLLLAWRAIDTRNGRVVDQGSSPVGVMKPGSDGFFYSALVAPKVLGTYKLQYELREADVAVSDTATTTVTVGGPRTYPDDNGGRTPGPITVPPRASPTRAPFGSPSPSLIPR